MFIEFFFRILIKGPLFVLFGLFTLLQLKNILIITQQIANNKLAKNEIGDFLRPSLKQFLRYLSSSLSISSSSSSSGDTNTSSHAHVHDFTKIQFDFNTIILAAILIALLVQGVPRRN